ncbi:uncharacterized protein LOC110715721 [Chenopodium quinoa]|uniref:uncharacterized protein LOC110715721 n=1 Tax=Chenopodium quinoa TaxID=63459 RepID=UPI000B780BC9|nr:uncharacterized protein LOC110715721 [Chenopodium quinoa]
MILPRARYDWLNLRLQEFKSVSEYNSVVFKITSQLKLCGENITDAEIFEKTYTTFHANNIVLQTQYREKAEQNNELLMKNHKSRPTGSTPFSEATVTTHNRKETKNRDHSSSSGRGRGRGRDLGQWRDRGRGRGYGRGRGGHFTNSHSHQKWECIDDKVEKEKSETNCRCHLKRAYVKHVVNMLGTHRNGN